MPSAICPPSIGPMPTTVPDSELTYRGSDQSAAPAARLTCSRSPARDSPLEVDDVHRPLAIDQRPRQSGALRKAQQGYGLAQFGRPATAREQRQEARADDCQMAQIHEGKGIRR